MWVRSKYFDMLLFFREVLSPFGKFNWLEARVLDYRKKHDLCWKLLDKDGNVIKRIF